MDEQSTVKQIEEKLKMNPWAFGPIATIGFFQTLMHSLGAVHVQFDEEPQEWVAPWTLGFFLKNCWRAVRFKRWESRKMKAPRVLITWCEGPTAEEAKELIEENRPAGVRIDLERNYPK